MKTICPLCLLFILLISQSGCTKADETPTVVDPPMSGAPASLKNSWELRFAYGGLRAPNTNPNYLPGNKNIWKLMDSTYQIYSNGVLQQTGKYTLTKDTCYATGRFMDAMILDKNTAYKLFFEVANDTLVMYRGVIAADGTIEKYVRIESYK